MGLFDNYQGGNKTGDVFANIYDPIGVFSGASKRNAAKKAAGAAPQFQPYSGYRPPHIDYTDTNGKQVNNLRNVQQMITDTLMRRSQGQDVGYDPSMVDKAKQNFNINQDQQNERARADITNELSGTGLSRNLAARDATLGRLGEDQRREQNKAFNDIDIASMERANQERDVNTGRLQQLNAFDFGQENKVADFDLGVYGAENNARQGAFQGQLAERAQDYAQDDSMGAGDLASLGLTAYGIYSGNGQASMIANALKNAGGSDTGKAFGATIDPNSGGYNQNLTYANSLANRKKLTSL